MKVVFKSKNLGEENGYSAYLIYLRRNNASSQIVGQCYRTTYGKWRVFYSGVPWRTANHDFDSLREARQHAKERTYLAPAWEGVGA
jgi:hypothetical protein